MKEKKEGGCKNGRERCRYLGRQFVTDFCGKFNAYLVSQDVRCDECKKNVKLDEVMTRNEQPLWK